MNNAAVIDDGGGHYRVRGVLTFDSVTGISAHGIMLFNGQTALDLDLSGISHTGSAGLALLLEWVRTARRNQQAIHFRNMPAQMLSIARLSGLETLLPLGD